MGKIEKEVRAAQVEGKRELVAEIVLKHPRHAELMKSKLDVGSPHNLVIEAHSS